MMRFRERPTIPYLAPWILVVSASVFAVVAILASVYTVVPGDAAIGRIAQKVPGLPQDVVADSSNLLGDPLTSSLIVFGLLVLCAARRFVQGGVFCLMILVCWIAGASLKLVFDSARPSGGETLVRDDHFVGVGFPSGHALTVTMFACAVSLVIPALFQVDSRTRTIVWLAWIWAIACMFSRIWLGAHWFTDVLGGFSLGIALTWTSMWVARRLDLPRFTQSHPAEESPSIDRGR